MTYHFMHNEPVVKTAKKEDRTEPLIFEMKTEASANRIYSNSPAKSAKGTLDFVGKNIFCALIIG